MPESECLAGQLPGTATLSTSSLTDIIGGTAAFGRPRSSLADRWGTLSTLVQQVYLGRNPVTVSELTLRTTTEEKMSLLKLAALAVALTLGATQLSFAQGSNPYAGGGGAGTVSGASKQGTE